MNGVAIAFTPEEARLVGEITLDVSALRGPDDTTRNGTAVAALMKLLIARKGIPEARLRYFTDPQYLIGGHGKSRKQMFERNGTRGDEIFRHPHFLEFLRYFLYGPSLPPGVIQAFRAQVARCGNVTSGDVVPLGKFAQQQARSLCPDVGRAAEEFYKLALDCGLWVSYAQSVRNAVKATRPRRR